MKKLFISLFVVAAVSFTACGGAAKTEDKVETPATEIAAPEAAKTVAQQYGELLTKNAEVAKKVLAGDATVAADAVKVQEELTKFMEENQEAISKFTEEELAEIAKVQAELTAEIAPEATK